MTQEAIRFGLIGAGAIAQSYAQAFNDSDSARIVAACDLDEARALALAERLGCVAYQTHEIMLEQAKCDAILVCTPPISHHQICLDALRRRVAVLCEKPLSLYSTSARSLFSVARQFGTILSMASKYRFVEDVIQAKSLVASGVLGEIRLLENSFTSAIDMSKRWNSRPEISGGGVLIDNGTHSLDLIRYLLGPVASILAVPNSLKCELPVEDTVDLFARTEDGVQATIELSWTLAKERENYIEIYGSNATLCVGWRQSKLRRTGHHNWEAMGTGYDKIAALRRQIRHFCRAIRGEESLLVSEEDALASVEVMETAYQSLEEQRWVSVNERPTRGRGRFSAPGAGSNG
ncbi:MAG: Gfo/Idh/MocA family oxidoreductase [bacterium]|nr:Gfo/Idh/MocA family oxidoreductase [bacterium]